MERGKLKSISINGKEFEIDKNTTCQDILNKYQDDSFSISGNSIPINPISSNLTSHQRHARLVKLTRKDYQLNNPKSRLFPNTSGVAWQGTVVNGAGKVELYNPRPVFFGIPEPEHKSGAEKSGGADLLGVTIRELESPDYFGDFPIFTAIECKTGNSRLKKNQKIFRTWVLSINGIYFVSRECPDCWDKWEPIYFKSKIIDWKIPDCPTCGGVGYKLEG